MKPKTIRYGHTHSLPLYQNDRLDIEAEVESWEDIVETYLFLKKKVREMFSSLDACSIVTSFSGSSSRFGQSSLTSKNTFITLLLSLQPQHNQSILRGCNLKPYKAGSLVRPSLK